MGICAQLLRHLGRGHGRLHPHAFLASTVLAVSLLAGGQAHGECIELPFPDLQALAALEDADANQTLSKARALIASGQGDHSMPPLRLAALYAIEAQSSSSRCLRVYY